MIAASYFDVPAHPLGIVTHPNWDAVRERYNALRCEAIISGQFRDQKAGTASAVSAGSARA